MNGLTDIPQEQMEEAMQRACDEQAEVMAGTDMTLEEAVKIVEPYVPKSDFDGQDKNILRNGDSWVCPYCGKRVYSMEVHPCYQPYCEVRYE